VWVVAAEALQRALLQSHIPAEGWHGPKHGGHLPWTEAEREAEQSTLGPSALAKAGGIERRLLLLKANRREFGEGGGGERKTLLREQARAFFSKILKVPLLRKKIVKYSLPQKCPKDSRVDARGSLCVCVCIYTDAYAHACVFTCPK